MPDLDLIVIGEINPDLILRGPELIPAFGQVEQTVDDATLTIGSSSVIMACGAARLGLRTAFVGLVGDDQLGCFMLDAMQRRKVDVSACVRDRAYKTGLSVILSQPQDRAILSYLGATAALSMKHIDPVMLRRARHLHVGSYFLLEALQSDLPALYAQAHDMGLSTSLDTNWDPLGEWDSGLARVLRECDVFLPNKAEAQLISRRQDLREAMELLSSQVPVLVVKLGAEGARARQGKETVYAPSLKVSVVDTTGAGDSFDAGFLYGYVNGWCLREALQLGCACGSLSTRAPGGTEGQPTLAQARDALAHASYSAHRTAGA